MSIFDIMSQQQSPSMGGTGGIGALAGNAIYPQSRMDKTQYATPMQLPTSADVVSSDYDPKTDAYTGMPNARFAKGGEVEDDPSDINYKLMALSANPKYDPRFMPLRLDERPISDVQAALLRLQAEKQIGEGQVRAGLAGLVGALPGRHGVSALPGAYDIGYNTPVGPGNLDVSAYRAMKAMPDGKVPQGVRASYSIPFAEGGEAESPTWDPTSGQVKLQQYEDPKDPFSAVSKTIDYSIPKDNIKDFIPNTDPETGLAFSGGQYILKDGSTLGVDGSGVVHAATPGRNDYTLNKEGYYQPTGSNLTWDGGLSRLTKKVGGVDVEVPGLFTKGGYQDAQGQLRTDANGVPIPLAPNYLDSGAGKSGLADAAPYIAAAALGGGAYLAAPALTGFAGMVPASETLLGSLGAASAAAPTVGSTVAPTTTGAAAAPGYGINFGASGASGGINAGALGGSAGITAPSTASLASGAGLGITEGSALAGTGLGAAKTAGLTGTQKFLAASLAAKALGGGSGGGGGSYPTTSTTTTEAPRPQTNIASQQFNPYQNYAAMTMPNMGMTAPGAYYQPMTYRYYAQGGVADLGGYAVGGKLLKGAGDGMSDDIEANIGGQQPARLADGEFVIPADVVSHLGNGSTDAGAKQLYKMMDRIRQARTGNKKQGKQINPEKFFPKE